jgi:Cdc6-like AAA superfamily ATPase
MNNHNHHENHGLNPFSPQYPAQPEYFAGRKREISEFRRYAINSAKLKPPTPLNYAILGTWGMGKTSLLYEFKQIVLQELQRDIRCIGIYQPLFPQACKTWDVFVENFLRTCGSSVDATQKIRAKIIREVKSWQVEFNLGVVSAGRKGEEKQTDIVEALESLWHKHLKPAGTEIAFIFIDDLHYFPATSDDSPYLNIRAVFQELVNRKCNYSLVVTAHSALFTEISELAEPLTRFFKRFELQPFTFSETKEAVEKRLDAIGRKMTIDDEVIQSIVEKTLGHPYFIMFVMFELLGRTEQANAVDMRLFKKIWPEIEHSLSENVLAQKFDAASPKEKELLIEIAKSKKDVFSASDFKKFKSVYELIARLERQELLTRKERGRYALFHPLFVDYLLAQEE